MHFISDHKTPLTADAIHEILPDVIGLHKELLNCRIDEKIQDSLATPPDHQLVAENAVKHAVQAVDQGREHELYQFTDGRRRTRAGTGIDPVAVQYLETHGLAPAADAFSREPIEALEAISKQLGSSPDAAGIHEFLLSHKNVEEARIPEEHALNTYIEFSNAAMKRHNWNVGSVAYKDEVYHTLNQHSDLSGRRQALEEQHKILMGRLGISKARGEEILAGSPVNAARDALISVTLARYAFLKKHALAVFTDKVDNAIVVQDHNWVQAKRASLAADGYKGTQLDQLVNDARTYRQSGLQNLQITDAIHDGTRTLSEVITRELGKTEAEISAELRQHSERLETALKDVARQIGGSINEAAEYVAETQRQTGKTLNATLQASISAARDATTKQHKILTSIYDAVHKEKKQKGIAEKTTLDVAQYSLRRLGYNGAVHFAKIALSIFGIPPPF